MVSDEEIRLEWAKIPHFYTPFYVYQYATGIAAAACRLVRLGLVAEVAVHGMPHLMRQRIHIVQFFLVGHQHKRVGYRAAAAVGAASSIISWTA